MTAWKIINLILSGAILIAGIVTVVQFSRLVWQQKTDENIRKFKHLAIRFGVLVAMVLLLQFVTWLIRFLYLYG